MTLNISNQSLLSSVYSNSKKQSATKKNNKKQQPLSFGYGIVALAKKNLGHQIEQQVVHPFNHYILPGILDSSKKESAQILQELKVKPGDTLSKPEDLPKKVDFFSPMAGAANRFQEMSDAVTNGEKGLLNKNSIPLPVKGDDPLNMPDIAMSQGRHFLDNKGYRAIVSDQKTGSIGDLITDYLKNPGKKPRDTIIYYADNAFDTNPKELSKFFVESVNDPNTHVALIGAARRPDEVADRFGVINVAKQKDAPNDIMKVTGFTEKPPLEDAKKMAIFEDANGEKKTVANTGMFYLSSDAIKGVLKGLKENPKLIAKNDVELYDGSNAIKYVQENMGGAKVKILDKGWEDIGSPDAYVKLLKGIRDEGKYLQNFGDDYGKQVQNSVKDRLGEDEKGNPIITFSNIYSKLSATPQHIIEKARNVPMDNGKTLKVIPMDQQDIEKLKTNKSKHTI